MRTVKKRILFLLKNRLVVGSAVLFFGNMGANFGNYLFHLLAGRMLGPLDYGILASLISLTYLLNIPVGALGLVVVKYVSAFRGKKELGKTSYFYFWLNKKLLLFGSVGFFLLVLISPLCASFLHLASPLPVILVVISSLVGVYLAVNMATLQGFLRFGLMSVLGIIQVVVKLTLAVSLIYLGCKVWGAVAAVLMSCLLALALTSFFVFRLLRGAERKDFPVDLEVARYAVPVFFSTFAFTALYTLDLVLVRHFLSAREAGLYAALSTLGKIIFFAANPIVMVMFPMVSERHANGKSYFDFLYLGLGLTFLVCLGISTIYFFFPRMMIGFLYGQEYFSAAPYLGLFAVFLSLYTFTFLITSFYLSIKKTKVVFLPMVAALTQAVLISFWHRNISQVVWISISVLSLLLIGLLLYYYRDGQGKKTVTFRHCSRV